MILKTGGFGRPFLFSEHTRCLLRYSQLDRIEARRLSSPIIRNIANRERMEIFFTILIMTLVVSLSGVFTRVLPFQLPLPLMQIAIGACWRGRRLVCMWNSILSCFGAVHPAAALCRWLEDANA
jgi:glucose-6-phosphate-specific signal transduction histidine kinase